MPKLINEYDGCIDLQRSLINFYSELQKLFD